MLAKKKREIDLLSFFLPPPLISPFLFPLLLLLFYEQSPKTVVDTSFTSARRTASLLFLHSSEKEGRESPQFDPFSVSRRGIAGKGCEGKKL